MGLYIKQKRSYTRIGTQTISKNIICIYIYLQPARASLRHFLECRSSLLYIIVDPFNAHVLAIKRSAHVQDCWISDTPVFELVVCALEPLIRHLLRVVGQVHIGVRESRAERVGVSTRADVSYWLVRDARPPDDLSTELSPDEAKQSKSQPSETQWSGES